ncbi:YolD-like family protein [Oceanobacillus sp. 143]|uniref:YolD-like family protein n=1 Tax=Oceanobacillus zhaokaii TaxID=2052660 RepID=A0A345PH28_9BACI|nr:YolD-like family protein [Oceanobacillus zhaokaii]AXI09308.1 YolD-like family protein [Oceanobacillus zhaokaii]QGS68795.1 YolD-like family protein [Oceanobacillus sp. 143]
MTKDRGTIKWSSLMLPEHVELLKELWKEDEKVRKPLLDPQQIEIIHNDLMDAYHSERSVTISFYQNVAVSHLSGVITKLDQYRNSIILQTDDNERHIIPFQQIISLIVD